MGSFLVFIGCVLWLLLAVAGVNVAEEGDWSMTTYFQRTFALGVFLVWPFLIFGSILAFAK